MRDVEKWLGLQGDPACGQWAVDQQASVVLWVDASNAAIGVALEIGNYAVENASWLRG